MKQLQILSFALLLGTSLLGQQTLPEILAELPSYNTQLVDRVDTRYDKDRVPISKNTWEQLNLKRLEDYDSSFQYYARQKSSYSNLQLLLIERYYDSESQHWLLLLDKGHNIIDYIETAYDNAEGFASTNARVGARGLVVYQYNTYEIPGKWKEIYAITENGFIQQYEMLYVTAPSGLSLRERPDHSSNRIAVLPFDSELQFHSKTKETFTVVDNGISLHDDWIKVKIPASLNYEEQEYAYAFGAYLQKRQTFHLGDYSLHFASIPAGIFKDRIKKHKHEPDIGPETMIESYGGDGMEAVNILQWHSPNGQLRLCGYTISVTDACYMEAKTGDGFGRVTDFHELLRFEAIGQIFWTDDETFYFSHTGGFDNNGGLSYWKVTVR